RSRPCRITPRGMPCLSGLNRSVRRLVRSASMSPICFFFFFKQKTAYEIGLGIPAEPLFRSTNLASHFFDLVIGKILTSRLSLSKHLAHNLGNLLLLGKIGVFHNRRNASSRLLLLISKHLILCIYLVFRILA